ncbi:MAG: hypothetical protein ABIC95_03020 [archaeon]
MKKTATFALLGLLLVGLVASASAFGGKMFGDNEALESALDNNDYEAFVSAIGDDDRGQRMADHMTEERFAQMIERHQWRESVQTAVESGDYDAWVAAHADKPVRPEITDLIDEESFPTLVAMHQARQDGDVETAQELAEKLGLPARGRGGPHGFQGKACLGQGNMRMR